MKTLHIVIIILSIISILFAIDVPLIYADCTFCPENYDPHKTPNDDTFMIGLYVVITVIVATVIAFFVYYRLK